jgi:hypothetical protein
MPSLSDMYAKFGETSEAAQLLEIEVGNLLLWARVAEHNLLNKPDPVLARKIFDDVDRKTLGQLIRTAQVKVPKPENLEDLLSHALQERNRLNHTFYKQHNFRRNSVEGRALMLQDLERIHDVILDAYKALLMLGGFDIENTPVSDLPTVHLPL